MYASLYAHISDGIILYYDENFCTMFVPICHYPGVFGVTKVPMYLWY